MARFHKGCSTAFHDALIGSDLWWARGVRSTEYQHVTGTVHAVERGVCNECSRTIVRRRVTLSEAILGTSPGADALDERVTDEWDRPPTTVQGFPRPPLPAEALDLDWWLQGDTITDIPVVER